MNTKKISQRITNFERRFGQAHVYLAYHAAFPLALTPDLTYRTWANFQRDTKGELLKNRRGGVLHIPWIAVADLLLSDFCSEVAYELYEMEQPIRNELLKRLRKDERFGGQRIEELSQFLLQYIDQQLRSDDPYIRNFAKSQKWIVNAYTNTNEVARELAEALSARVRENDKGGVIRVAFVPGNELPGYFQLSLRDRANCGKSGPGNGLPGCFQPSRGTWCRRHSEIFDKLCKTKYKQAIDLRFKMETFPCQKISSVILKNLYNQEN